jgi:hypothetical protein
MRKKTLLSLLLCLAICDPLNLSGQVPQTLTPESLADQWFIRLNDLSRWHISFDGKEENSAVVDRFIELYGADAYHQVGPSEDQIGQVVLHGKDAIRKWADEFSKKYVGLAYRVEYKTRQDKPSQPFYVAKMPWGGTGVSTEFSAIYTNREDRRQFVVPGAVFFLFDASGKIDSVRLYLLRDEMVEIGG